MFRMIFGFWLISVGLAFAADPAIGMWKTQPDRKDLTAHIQIRACGEHLCGRIVSAYNRAGEKVNTPNIGKELFWGMSATGEGAYRGGTVWVPLLNVEAKGSMKLSGNRLIVRGCKGPVCDGQTWSRLQ
jgi:uncharacterized protein (DUF2147 family)